MTNLNHFNIEEFIIDPSQRYGIEPIPPHVINKIMTHHLPVLNPVREELGMPLHISKHSGYRPLAWEILKGRNGLSQHCFEGLGAVDLTCDDMPTLVALLKISPYKRVVHYVNDGFVHCDFKGDDYNFYICEKGNKWEKVSVHR